jgi:putative ATP-dependent endonuclease of the OLD family
VHIERLTLTNFRCFGPKPVSIDLEEQLTALIGANGAGKTAALAALMRLFGVTQQQRQLRVQDFHVPVDEDRDRPPPTRTLSVDVVLAFPELDNDAHGDGADDEDDEDDRDTDAVPEFFIHMAANDVGALKCRIRLDATWQEDGSIEGAITEKRCVIRTLEDEYTDEDSHDLSPSDRSRIQMVYVPALRDGAQHLTAFLRGRLWRAVIWSDSLRDDVKHATDELNVKFGSEAAVTVVKEALEIRWQQLHSGGTDAEPEFRPVSREFGQFVDRAELFFEPTETGPPRGAADLSDGQRSLLHIALTASGRDRPQPGHPGSIRAR